MKASKYKPVEIFLQQIKGKYKIPILIQLKHSKKRYNQIRQKFPDASERIIIKQLKELVRSNIIERKVFGTKPPLISEYSLSPYGRTLCGIIAQMWDWGMIHLERKNELPPNVSYCFHKNLFAS
jgi:DNA-binding HxlR family transcriptional regulator